MAPPADVFASTTPTSYEPEMAELAADSPDAMWELLASRGLGDGLPVVPPTRARVDAVLDHAEGDADEVLFTLQPRAGLVTRRVAAVNAVMAGCPPETFPVDFTLGAKRYQGYLSLLRDGSIYVLPVF